MKLKEKNPYFRGGITLLLVVLVSILFSVIVTNLRGFFDVLAAFVRVISPVLYGVVFAFLLNPLVNLLETAALSVAVKKSKKPARTEAWIHAGSIFVALVVGLFMIYGLIYLLIPQLYDTIYSIVMNMPRYLRQLESAILALLEDSPELWGAAEDFLGSISGYLGSWLGPDGKFLEHLQTLVVGVTGAAANVVREVLNILIGLVAAVYILGSKKKFQAQATKLVVALFRPRTADRLLHLGRETHRVFGGFIVGKLIDSLIIGVICYFGMLILRLPFPVLIATIVGITNIIPFFGPFIGIVPSALLILLVNPLQSLYFVIFSVILQQIDGNIIGPKILGDSIGISGFWVLVSITVAGNLFGFAGMILGVPVFALLYMLVKQWVEEALKKKQRPAGTDLYYGIHAVDELPSSAAEEDSDQLNFLQTEKESDEA